MKNKLSLFSICLVVFLLVGFVACAAPQPTAPTATPSTAITAKTIELSFNIGTGEKSPDCQLCLIPWAEEVKKVTQGRVTIKFYWSGALSIQPEAYASIVNGVADMGWAMPSHTPGKFPLSGLLEIPYAFPPGFSSEDSSKVAWEFYEKIYNTNFKEVHVLGQGMTDAADIYTMKKPIKTMADLKGLKIRAPGQVASKAMELLGAVPVSMGAQDLYDALQKGVAEGALTTTGAISMFKLHELLRQITPAQILRQNSFVVVNKDSWNRLSPDDQQSIEEVSGIKYAELWGYSQKISGQDAINLLMQAGAQNNPLSATELEAWKKTTMPVVESTIADLESKGLPGQKGYTLLMDLIKKYAQ